MQASTPTLLMPTTGFSDGAATFSAQATISNRGGKMPGDGLLGAPAGELVLRICGGEHDGRVLRIQAAKCSIGSAAGCTFRLRTNHLRPVHALILRGPKGAVIRCWTPDVLLNGRACDESTVRSGDVLQIGPLKLHIEQVNQAVSQPKQEEMCDLLPARKPRRDRRRKQLIGILRQERQQQLSLQQTISEQQSQLNSLQAQLSKLPAASETSPPNEALTAQLTRTIEQLQQELAAAAQRRTTEQQSAAKQRQLFDEQMQQRLQTELDRQREHLQLSHQKQLEQARTELSRRLEQSKAAERLTLAAEIDSLKKEIAASSELQQTLARENESLQLALHTKSSGEELARLSAATQIEQLSRAFELVRQERDELFQRLQDEQRLFDEQVARWQQQIDDTRASAQSQLNEGEAAANKQLALVRAELATRDSQLFEVQQQAREREAQWQDESRRQIAELRAQLTAKTEAEESRRIADAQKIAQLTGTIDALRSEASTAANSRQQEQDGFTQARKRLEAEISALQARLERTDAALHEVRANSGMVNVEVLGEAERARAERDEVRDQLLRQQQEWTEFRSRLEMAAVEERELASARAQNLQEALAVSAADCEQLQTQLRTAEQRLGDLQTQLDAVRGELAERVLECELQQSDLTSAEIRRSDLQRELDSALEDLTHQSLECEQLKVELSQVEQRHCELKSQFATIAEEREVLTAEHTSLRQAASEQKVQFEQLRTELRQLQADLEATNESQLAIQQAAQSQERELTSEIARLQDDVASRELDCELLRQRLRDAELAQEQLRSELNTAVEASVVAERSAASRLQQMTISMDQLHLDQASGAAEVEEERAAWERERDSLAQCVAELRLEVSALKESLATAQEQTRQSTAESLDRAQLAEQQLQTARAQVTEWQSVAEEARQQAAELSQSMARLRQQEQLWQMEREQLDFSQQTSNERLQQLESSITQLQQQLSQTQSAVGPLATPLNQTAALITGGFDDNVGSTINVNNQELAALHEQLSGSVPSLLDPRISRAEFEAEVLQAKTAELHEKAEELAAQQMQLEEEQATVARQRIELEQFQASLAQLERSLLRREEELAQRPTPPVQPSESSVEVLADESEQFVAQELERESNPLSESEAFAAMADQVAALYRTPPPKATAPTRDSVAVDVNALSASSDRSAEDSHAVGTEIPNDLREAGDAAVIPSESDESLVIPNSAEANRILTPIVEEAFEHSLEAHVARVMGRETNPWHKTGSVEPEAEENSLTQSDAVNNVLDRLREAGLWKGEGTAKVDQLPSSDPPVDGGAAVLYRPTEEVEPIRDETPPSMRVEAPPPDDNLSLLAPAQGNTSLVQSPSDEETEADDSIENYMSRLMQRLRTTSDTDGPPNALRRSSSRTSGAPSSRPTMPAATPVEPAVSAKPADMTPLTSLSELAPRSQAPEANANLAAMRELANSAARGAIEQHQQKSGMERVSTRTVNTGLAVVVAAGLFYCWYQTGATLALGGMALALLWGLSSSLLAGMQTASLRKSPAPEAEKTAPESHA